jgi:hypothetical protein
MARDGDSEPVTRAMIAAGISQLPPMNMSLAEVSELLRFGVRARLRRSSRPMGCGLRRPGSRGPAYPAVCRRCPGRRQSGRSLVLGLWLAMWDALQRLEGGGRGHVALTSFNNAEGRTAAQMGLRIALPCHCHFATPCHFATRSAFS